MAATMQKPSFTTNKNLFKVRNLSPCTRKSFTPITCSHETEKTTSRRDYTLGMLASTVLLSKANPSEAAYGDSANVFGKITNQSGFIPYTGQNYAVQIPSKWNPSKEKDFKGVDLRYEDNFDAVNNMTVLINKTDKKSVKEYGTPEEFLNQISYLFGQQSYSGETQSEGGFKKNRVSAASLLDVSEEKKAGKDYYGFELLVRTADGDEGGRHQLISSTVGSDGNLYILKVQCGDKRWFKGVKREAVGVYNSFIVA